MALDADELIGALERSEGITGWIGVLWTWLEARLPALDKREEKLRDLRALGVRAAPDDPIDLEAALEELRGSSDLLRAAGLALVALDRWVAESGRRATIHGLPVPGVDGAHYIVAARNSWLARMFWEGSDRDRELPPATDYAPAMEILAPAVTVSPARVGPTELRLLSAPESRTRAARTSMAAAKALLAAVASGEPRDGCERPPMSVHLATLGPVPRASTGSDLGADDGFQIRGGSAFSYSDPPDGSALNDAISATVHAAVEVAAREGATLLLMPELALPVGGLDALRDELRATTGAPALTIVGLRHRDIVAAGEPEHDSAGVVLSRWVNEAVVLGPDGTELLRHRKLTAYSIDHDGPQEDTRVGDRLTVLPTAVGNLAVITCLDAFAASSERVRRSPASVVLVPSLSARLGPHRATLAPTVTSLWGMAFVCNRHPTAAGDAAWQPDSVRSFWTVGMLNGWRRAPFVEACQPTLVFDLDNDRAEFQ